METIWDELQRELGAGFGDRAALTRVTVRLLGAMLLGAVVGYERERSGRWAGLRTHMLVALGSALLVLIPAEAGVGADVTRVVQGIATGIGFIGAGSILKLTKRREIQGLTTAAGIWVTAAVGVSAGLGFLGPALLAVVLAWLVLGVFGRIEAQFARAARARGHEPTGEPGAPRGAADTHREPNDDEHLSGGAPRERPTPRRR